MSAEIWRRQSLCPGWCTCSIDLMLSVMCILQQTARLSITAQCMLQDAGRSISRLLGQHAQSKTLGISRSHRPSGKRTTNSYHRSSSSILDSRFPSELKRKASLRVFLLWNQQMVRGSLWQAFDPCSHAGKIQCTFVHMTITEEED